MPPKAAAASGAGKPKRKRQRKGRTLAVSSDESASSSSSSSESESDSEKRTSSIKAKAVARQQSSASSSSSSSSSSGSSSDSESSAEEDGLRGKPAQAASTLPPRSTAHIRVTPPPSSDSDEDSDDEMKPLETLPAPSKTPLSAAHQAIVRRKFQPELSRSADKQGRHAARQERKAQVEAKKAEERQKRKEAFRSLWLKTMAGEFGDELDAIRTKEPTLGADGGTRLPLFIDALTAGSEVFASSTNNLSTTDEVSLAMNLS